MTSLYIKQHLITGKLYLGKTVQDPVKYTGSGKAWKQHLEEHGYLIETLWHHKFENQEECTSVAKWLSAIFDVVDSDRWLNKMPEDGLNGGWPWMNKTADHLAKIVAAKRGKPISESHRKALCKRSTGAGNARARVWILEQETGLQIQVHALKPWCKEHKIPYSSMLFTQKSHKHYMGFRIVDSHRIHSL